MLLPLVIVGAGALVTWQAYDRGLENITSKTSTLPAALQRLRAQLYG